MVCPQARRTLRRRTHTPRSIMSATLAQFRHSCSTNEAACHISGFGFRAPGLITTAGVSGPQSDFLVSTFVAADPHEPAVADLLGELEREVAAQRQHLLNRRHQANGQSKPEQEKSQVAPTPKTCAKVTHGNGVKP